MKVTLRVFDDSFSKNVDEKYLEDLLNTLDTRFKSIKNISFQDNRLKCSLTSEMFVESLDIEFLEDLDPKFQLRLNNIVEKCQTLFLDELERLVDKHAIQRGFSAIAGITYDGVTLKYITHGKKYLQNIPEDNVLLVNRINGIIEKHNNFLKEQTPTKTPKQIRKEEQQKKQDLLNQLKSIILEYKKTGVINLLDVMKARDLANLLKNNRGQIENALMFSSSSLLLLLLFLISSSIIYCVLLSFTYSLELLGRTISVIILSCIWMSSLVYGMYHLDLKSCKLVNSFLEELMATYGLELNQKTKEIEECKEKKHCADKFLEFIKRDLEYISRHKDEGEYDDLIDQFRLLSIEYANALNTEMLGGSVVDRYKYSVRLTELEVEMYSRNEHIGLTKKDKVNLSNDILEQRLQHIGVGSEQSLNDKCIAEVDSTIKRILMNPYEGCEEEITELVGIVQEYVQKEIGEDDTAVAFDQRAALMKKLVDIEMTVGKKYARAEKCSQLKDDLEAIQSVAEVKSSEDKEQSEECSRGAAFCIQKKSDLNTKTHPGN